MHLLGFPHVSSLCFFNIAYLHFDLQPCPWTVMSKLENLILSLGGGIAYFLSECFTLWLAH